MITKINTIVRAGLAGCLVAAALIACTDTWDDHYDKVASGVGEGSIWEAIQANPELSNFSSVVEACGYDKSLASSQVFTVFAPTNANFSEEEARALIAAYNSQKNTVSDEDNTVIKEFVQNHIALYNYSTSSLSDDSIVMMNGKYTILTPDSFGNSRLLTANSLFGNGVLFTVDRKVDYFPNIFEYISKDAELDSLRSFLYNEKFYHKVFMPNQSVEGGLENGKTVYLDSVFRQTNELYRQLDYINSEDSSFWMLAPTNEVWKDLVDEYSKYFNYEDNVDRLLGGTGDRDSLVYTNTRLAIIKGTVFSQNINSERTRHDSLYSENAVLQYNRRRSYWGADSLHYYQYNRSMEEFFKDTRPVECSNGQLFKTDRWTIGKNETFSRVNIIECESMGNLKEVSRTPNRDSTVWNDNASISYRYVSPDNEFYGRLSGNGFVELRQTNSLNYDVTFNIGEVLSNMGYDIYLITAPALAADSNATYVERLPTRFYCTLTSHNQKGANQDYYIANWDDFETTPDAVDCFLLAENYKFDVATYGLREDTPQVTLRLRTDVKSGEITNDLYTRTLRIDCIILVPHPEGE